MDTRTPEEIADEIVDEFYIGEDRWRGPMTERLAAAIRAEREACAAAVAAERERCAKIAEEHAVTAHKERYGLAASSVGPAGEICLSLGAESEAKAIATAIRKDPDDG